MALLDIGTLAGRVEISDNIEVAASKVIGGFENIEKKFEGLLGTIAIGSATAVAAIGGIAVSIISLGQRGSEIDDVANTLTQFAGSAEHADKILAALRTTTKGTVTDFDLMRSSSKLLSAGVKLSADQFETLGSAARVLSNRGLGPAKQQLDLINQALITGRTRSLSMALGVIDAGDATKKYADFLGVAESALTRTQRVEATRRQVLELLNKAVKDAGDQQLSFSERLDIGKVKLTNWFDTLGRAIATSPRVLAAMDSIGKSIEKAFGTNGQRAIDLILAGVNKFADFAAKAAESLTPVGDGITFVIDKIQGFWNWLVTLNEQFHITDTIVDAAVMAFSFLKAAFNLVKEAVEAVITAWKSMPDWLQRLSKGALEAGIAAGAYAVAIGGAAAVVKGAFVSSLDLAINIIGNLTGAIYSITQLTALWRVPVDAVTLAYTRLNLMLTNNTVVIGAYLFSVKAAADAQALLVTWVTALSARLGLNTAATAVNTAATNLLTTAKTLLSGVVTFLTTSFNLLTVRLGLNTAAMAVSTAATGLATHATTALGLALNALKFILLPLAAVWAAWEFGKWLASFPSVQRGVLWLIEKLPFVSSAAIQARRDALDLADGIEKVFTGFQRPFVNVNLGLDDTAVNKFIDDMKRLGEAQGFANQELTRFVQDAVNRIEELKDNGSKALAALNAQFHLLAGSADAPKAAWEKLAKAYKALEEAGTPLGPQARELVRMYDAAAKAAALQADREMQREQALQRAAAAANVAAQKEEERLKKLTAVNEKLKEATAEYAPLDRAQQQAVELYTRLGLSAEEMAVKLDVSTLAIKKNQDQLAKYEQMDALGKKVLDAVDANAKARTKLIGDSIADQFRTGQEFLEKNRQLGMNQHQLEMRQIELEREARRKALDFTEIFTGNTALLRAARQEMEEYYEHQIRLANRSADTIEERMARQNVLSRRLLKDQAADFLLEFKQMEQSGLFTIDELAAAWLRYKDAEEMAVGDTVAWQRKMGALRSVGAALNELGRSVTGNVGTMVSGIGQLIDGWVRAAEAIREYGRQLGGATREQRLAAIASGVTGVIGATSTGTRGQRVGGGIIAGAQAGMAIGSVFPGIGTAVGAGVGAIAGGLVGLFRSTGDEAKKIVREFLNVAGGSQRVEDSLARLGAKGVELGQNLRKAFRGSADDAKKAVKDIQDALARLDADIQKYNLTWEDMLDPTDRLKGGTLAAKELIDTFNRLSTAGFNPEKILEKMGGDVNEWLGASLRAGNQIPQAMLPIVKRLIETKQLTEDNARLLLGMADDGVPSLNEIKDAAERYGLTLDQLGPKVKGLMITEEAKQIVKDWDILTRAGVPFETMIGAMKTKIQDVVKQALILGIALPESMRPIIQRLIDAGELTDEFGEKLTDTSRLNFETPLTDKIDDLIEAINGLVTGPLTDLINKFIEFGDEGVTQADRVRDAIERAGGVWDLVAGRTRNPPLEPPGDTSPEEPTDNPDSGGGGGGFISSSERQTNVYNITNNVDNSGSFWDSRERMDQFADRLTPYIPDGVTRRALDRL